jgi:hypothetical protein
MAFVLGLFIAVFAGMPWYVMVSHDPVVPWWLRIAVFCLLGDILAVLATLALEQRAHAASIREPLATDNLPFVFKLGQEPWVDPNGALKNEIIATVEKCPSGALSYSVKGEEYRNQDREPLFKVSKDGPYLVRSGIEIVGHANRAQDV